MAARHYGYALLEPVHDLTKSSLINGKDDHVQTGRELSLAVFPKATALLNPSKGTLDYPTFGGYRKHM
ncbi:MAG: hypothetical protein ACJAT5_000302 [Lentimonas sp.]|jgi:hypothetical protein